MPPRSSIARLPPEIRAELDRLIRERRHTIDEIVVHLRQLGGEVKRTAVGDYKKRMEASLARYREAQEVAGVFIPQLGINPDSQMGQLLAELLKTVAFRTLADMQQRDDGAEPMEIMLLSKALSELARAQKTDQEFREKVRAEYRRELEEKAKQAEAAVAKVARRAGLTGEAAAEIRRHVLGIVG